MVYFVVADVPVGAVPPVLLVDPVIDLSVPIPSFNPSSIIHHILTWDLNLVVNGQLAVSGLLARLPDNPVSVDGPTCPGIVLDGETEHIEVTPTGDDHCLSDIMNSQESGFTLSVELRIDAYVDNMVVFSTGGEHEDSTGVSIIYALGEFQLIVSDNDMTWRTSFPTFDLGIWTNLDITWDATDGVAVHRDGRFQVRRSRWLRRAAAIVPVVHFPMFFGRSVVEDATLQRAPMAVGRLQTFCTKRVDVIGAGLIKAGLWLVRGYIFDWAL